MEIPRIGPPFVKRVQEPVRAAGSIDALQVNVGYACNLQCRHCHVTAGPRRTEAMSPEVMAQCLEVLKKHTIPAIDVTGGSPELHPRIEWFLQECAALTQRVVVRSNGVILLQKEHERLVDLYARNRIEVVLSLPLVDPRATDRQRGEGAFSGVIEAMHRLNAKGYGRAGCGLVLDLVHNPVGAYLPGSQSGLEARYRQVLEERYGVCFNHLFCITNMPIGRYLEYLLSTDNYEDYMKSLIKAFNPVSLSGLMCKSTVSVGWNGTLYDCDFNQMLRLPMSHGAPRHISAFEMGPLVRRDIVVGDHCYGCTAGRGSSCRGQTA